MAGVEKVKHVTSSKNIKLALQILLAIGVVAVISVCLLKIKYTKKTNVEVIIDGTKQDLYTTQNPIEKQKERYGKSLREYRPWENIRLPNDVIPKLYNISLSVDMEKENYEGLVKIQVDILNDTNFIVLHQSGLNLKTVIVQDEQHTAKMIDYRRNEPKFEYHVIRMSSTLRKGQKYYISIYFNNTIRDGLSGFFITKHNNSKIAATFFSPINARTAFPCFDQPNFKASFVLSITSREKYSALSNMQVDSVTKLGDLKTTTFKPTVRMSTYIFAWVIHDDSYQNVQKVTRNGLVINTWYFKDELHKFESGMNATLKLLEYFEIFFDSEFPLQKLDVAIMPYFIPSAMENWGLMTFRKNRYIVDHMDFTSLFSYTIISHEIVHQWFGNLATMEYWNEAWLKEGFANYLGNYGGREVQPELPIGEFVYDLNMKNALKYDSFSSTHSLTPKLATNSEIREMFDVITYNKGSCMVQMLQKYLGNEIFKKGLQQFLKQYKYKNANQEELWQVMGKTSGRDVKSFMREWTEEDGYPLLQVNRINATHVSIEQERFLQDPPKQEQHNNSTTWQVLIVYRPLNGSSNGTSSLPQTYILTQKRAIFSIPKNSILNPDHEIYYRIKYGPVIAEEIIDKLNTGHEQLTGLDRIGLINDQLNIMAAQRASLNDTMKYLAYLSNESRNEIWKEVITHFMMIYDILPDGAARTKWGKFVHDKYVLPKLQSYPQAACKLNSTFFIKRVNRTASGISGMTYGQLCCAIKNDVTDGLWNTTMNEFLRTKKTDHMRALTCSKDTRKIEIALQYTMDKSFLHSDSTTYTLKSIAENSHQARDATWNFVKTRWSEFLARYNSDIYYLKELIDGVVPLFSTQDKLHDVEQFFKTKELGTAAQAVRQSISQINMKIAYKTYMTKEIKTLIST